MSEVKNFFRSPWPWAFLVGILTITALRPFLIRRPAPLPMLVELPEYSLINQRGEAVGSDELAGRPYVANFFFASCPTFCPTLIDAMKRLQRGLRDAGVDDVRLVSITVDPERDSPARLAEYATQRGIDTAGWDLLTGEPGAVRDVIVNGFKLAVGERAEFSGSLYDIAHSGRFVLVDADGRIRGYFEVLADPDDESSVPTWDETRLDEIFHRSRDLARERR